MQYKTRHCTHEIRHHHILLLLPCCRAWGIAGPPFLIFFVQLPVNRQRKKSGARNFLRLDDCSMSVLKTSNPVATMRRQVVEWCATAAVIFGAADAFTPLVLLNNAPAARPNRATSLTMVEVRLSPLRVVQSCLKSAHGARSPSCCLHSHPSSGVVQHC